MALVPIFRPARFGLANRWRAPSDAAPQKATHDATMAHRPAAIPSPHLPRPEPRDDEREFTNAEKDELRERMATAVGALAYCQRAVCRRAGRCRGKSACLREHRPALQPALDYMQFRLKARLAEFEAGHAAEPKPDAEAAPGPSRRRPSRRRRTERREP